MKKMLLLALLSVVSTTTFASADLIKQCGSLAEKATEKNAIHNGYDKNGFEAYDCTLAPNNAVVICEVSAYKGDGAAVDTYRAILNKSCTKALRVDLLGEE